MKNIDFYYNNLKLNNEQEIFNYIMQNLKDTIRTYDFFVAWDKVINNVASIELYLNMMNSIIGKENIKLELEKLIKNYPEIVSTIPILIACRDKKINISTTNGDVFYDFSKKQNYSDTEISNILLFCHECGVLKVLENRTIKNLVDYCFGVEVGLDTNARKNRSGLAMENLVEIYVKDVCDKYNFEYINQATESIIRSKFNINVPVDKSDRHFDFAIKSNDNIYLLEVNYYSGGGSKLKSVAGEFKTLYNLLKTKENINFIWVTDGKGWETAKHPLEETFNHIDYVLNVKLIENGLLEEIITKGL